MRTPTISLVALTTAAISYGAPSTAFADDATSSGVPAATTQGGASPRSGLTLELTSLRLLREKGVISEAEYESALRNAGDSVGEKMADSVSLSAGKWSTTFYGFVETDAIYDSTQSFNDAAGATQVVRGSIPAGVSGNPQTYGNTNGRTQMSIRNSRLGLFLRAPEVSGIRTSGTLEMDFLGYEPSVPTSTEASFFNSPTMRLRHAYMRIETPYIDVLAGQTWHMFGWQEAYQPNTVEIQGLPGELYARTVQVRLSHAFRTDPLTVEVAAAALRPVQRDSMIPDVSGGFRFAFNHWTGTHTAGGTATSNVPASIAITGDMRNFKLPTFEPLPTSALTLTTGSIAASALLPIIPAGAKSRENSLTLLAQAVYGSAIADLYSGMTAGIGFPSIPVAASQVQGTTWPQDVDNGLVVYDNNPPLQYPGSGTASLHPILWESLLVGLEYYLPLLDGRVWLSANYSHMQSPNIADYTQPAPGGSQTSSYSTAANVRKAENWWDANLFFDPLPFVRVGGEFAAFYDLYADSYTAKNYRAQLSGWLRF